MLNLLRKLFLFLASAKVVITNTYHGVYWATLLGKKVLCYKPFSSRFFHTKYPPVFIESLTENLDENINNSKNYLESLNECRLANDNFYVKVASL